MGHYPRQYSLIRGFVPQDALDQLRDYIFSVYRTLDAQFEAGTIHPDFRATRSWDGLHVPHLKQHMDGEKPIDAVANLIGRQFKGARVIDQECNFRRHRGASSRAGWHTDADAAGSAPYDPCFNVWLPLMPVGIVLPSLELMPDTERPMRKMPRAPVEDGKVWSDRWRIEHFPDAKVECPVLNPGDVVIFSHYILHRTQPLPTQVGERISGEFRFSMKDAPWWRRLLPRIVHATA